MANGRSKIVDEDELEGWVREGRTARWIWQQYQEKYGSDVTYQTVAQWARTIRGSGMSPAWISPWVQRNKKSEPRQLRRLRFLYRFDAGGVLTDEQKLEMSRLLTRLEPTLDLSPREIVRRRATLKVLEYLPEENRWVYSWRRPGIDTDWIRDPLFDDAGKRRTGAELVKMGVNPEIIARRLYEEGFEE